MRIVLVTQEDAFYIPKLISSVLRARWEDIVAIAVLPGEMSCGNAKKYLDFMGPFDFVRYCLLYGGHAARNLLFPKGRSGYFYSVSSVAKHFGIPLLKPVNINDANSIDALRSLDVELLVSIAAPQIFQKQILDLPKYGCINIHNGLLPKYRGMMPSFWVLANGEKQTGTTIHYMNEVPDAGDIILQQKFDIDDDDTLHSLVYRTKVLQGPELLVRAIDLIEKGGVETTPIDMSKATYFSFPDAKAVRQFRKLGRKFR